MVIYIYIYCDEDEVIADLEEQEYFSWHLIEVED